MSPIRAADPFAELADLGRLELLAWEGQAVAGRLEDAAHRMRRILRPSGGTAEAPESAQTTSGESAPGPAAAGVAGHVRVGVAAVLLGFCVGLGQQVAKALLRRWL